VHIAILLKLKLIIPPNLQLLKLSGIIDMSSMF